MNSPPECPECGAGWHKDKTCQDNFHQMLFWENDNPANGTVHHLMVVSFHIQHPSLYSPEGLDYAKHLLTSFLVEGLTPQEVRQRSRDQVDSGQRAWKIKGTPDRHGSHPHPISWTMTAADVVAGGIDHYRANVQRWATSIHEALQTSSQP